MTGAAGRSVVPHAASGAAQSAKARQHPMRTPGMGEASIPEMKTA
jgi:hypothetical protein